MTITLQEMKAALDDILRLSPNRTGSVEMIVIRPDVDQRIEVEQCRIDCADGVVGDNWRQRGAIPKLDAQITLMNARVIQAVAGSRDRWALAGDQFFVDFDLSESNLNPGDQLRLGNAILRVTEEPHTGCAKFAARFGADAGRFVNGRDHAGLKLRGINCSVVEDGAVAVGDTIAKV
ncbi:MAG: MOSC domain-containing protein [Gammaproteobacteria bacterium]|nr:MOSC domain-containing protein [Gammaproteobacteria bacterium]